jgi:hypothetical protein
MAQSLIAIATFVALVGGVIFGVKQFEKKSEPDDNIELLNKPYPPLEKPTIPPASSEVPDLVEKREESRSVDPAFSPTELTAIEEIPFEEAPVADPWSELNLTQASQLDFTPTAEEPTQTVLDLGEIPRAERVEESYETIAPEKPEVIPDQLPLDFTPAEKPTGAAAQHPAATQPATVAEEPAVSVGHNEELESTSEIVAAEPVATELDWGNLEQPSPELQPEPLAQTPAVSAELHPAGTDVAADVFAADPLNTTTAPEADVAVASLQSVFAPEHSEALEPRHQVSEVIIPPTIQDPKRPSNQELEDLTQEILAWGQSKELKHLPKLIQNASHSDGLVRGNVAIALGQISASHPVRTEIEQAIPILGKLAQDSSLQVRQFAVQALGMIQSDKVLPYLQQALLSPSTSVMKAANDALQNLKLHYGNTPAIQTTQQMLDQAESTSKRRDL